MQNFTIDRMGQFYIGKFLQTKTTYVRAKAVDQLEGGVIKQATNPR